MRRLALFGGVAGFVVFASSAAAQDKPDFSGRWTTVPDSAAPPAAPQPNVAPGAGGRPGGGGGAGGRGAGGGGGRGRAGDMGSGWGPTITIAHDAAKLTVEYAFFGRGDMQPPIRYTYALDGSETKNSVMMGWGIQTQTSKVAWDGAKLTITTVHAFANPADGKPMTTTVKQTLSLESPTSLVVEVARDAVLGGAATSTRTVYRKLPNNPPGD